ncbi:MAG: hypothetical protein MCSN_0140 [Candidatus Microsyncoccus archaeolyticus]|jgi:hypothetical protein|nr:MAG: hypothetical protein MCSN_0140 [Candidatus Parcubacteria bacterium]
MKPLGVIIGLLIITLNGFIGICDVYIGTEWIVLIIIFMAFVSSVKIHNIKEEPRQFLLLQIVLVITITAFIMLIMNLFQAIFVGMMIFVGAFIFSFCLID